MPRRPVSRVLFRRALRFAPTNRHWRRRGGGGHLSSPAVADGIVRPTRRRAGRPLPPIRPCSGWGLPSLRRCHWSGALLPHLFTLAARQRGGMFLWHFPSGCPAPPLAGILPGGARTFLPPAIADRRPPGLLGAYHCSAYARFLYEFDAAYSAQRRAMSAPYAITSTESSHTTILTM